MVYRLMCDRCGKVFETRSQEEEICRVCHAKEKRAEAQVVRSGRRTSVLVRQRLEMLKGRQLESRKAEKMLECYAELSDEAKEGMEELIVSMCGLLRPNFGERQAIELIGALIEHGSLDLVARANGRRG